MTSAQGLDQSTDESKAKDFLREALSRRNLGIAEEVNTDETACEYWSDGDLVIGVLKRREVAFSELFRRHQRSVTACSRMILGNVSQCDDVASEVFIGFWLDPTKFDASRGSLLTYLRVQAKGRSIDLIRSETARARREKIVELRNQPPAVEVGVNVLASEAATQLHLELSVLPATEREPIELAYFGGMTYSAVARHLGLAEGTVKSRIRKGLERLQSAMGSQSPPGLTGATSNAHINAMTQPNFPNGAGRL